MSTSLPPSPDENGILLRPVDWDRIPPRPANEDGETTQRLVRAPRQPVILPQASDATLDRALLDYLVDVAAPSPANDNGRGESGRYSLVDARRITTKPAPPGEGGRL